MIDIDIRPADMGDAAAVHAIIQEAFAEFRDALPVPPGALNESLAQTESAVAQGGVVLVWAGTRAVGTGRWEARPECLYVGRVAVLPAWRNRGVGAALMRYMERIALLQGRDTVKLGTRQSMPGNIAFYTRLGYEITATEPHSKGPDTVVWLEKRLGSEHTRA